MNRPLPLGVLRHRDRGCTACPTPCALREAHDDPCDQCPLTPPAWPQWDCVPGAPTPLGDRIHAEIKTRILDRARPYAPAIVAAIEQCGGCRSTRRHLNGGKIAGEDAGPPVV
jgi:hypothetical protein